MATSGFALTGRFLAGIAAAWLLAGVSMDAAAYGSKGRLELTTGKMISSFGFEYQIKNASDNYEPPVPTASQAFDTGKGCTIFLRAAIPADVFSPARPMVTLSATGGRRELGYVSTSIGVFDGPQGTACGRISKEKDETLALEIGDYLSQWSANAFDRLELDLEVKGDVKLRVDVYFNGTKTNDYFLLAGAPVAGAVDLEGKELNPGDNTYKCSASSDSGPDAGARDNCRLIINDIGDKFVLVPVTGEVSLEGGGDFDLAPEKRTHIYLTEADGIFKCGDSISTAAGELTCGITRLDDSLCREVPYIFRSDSNSCTLTTDMGGTQLIANLFVTYASEEAPSAEDDSGNTIRLDDLEDWVPAVLSRVSFANDPTPPTNTSGAVIGYAIPPCLDPDFSITNAAVDADPPTGPDPIDGIDGKYDLVDDDADELIQFACAFLRREVYETEFGTDPSGQPTKKPKVKIKEGIQFWGDITFVRSQE